MPYQNLQGTIPPAVMAIIMTSVNNIKMELSPYVINLSMAERSNLYKMGPTRFSLAQKVIVVCDTLPIVVPNFVNPVEIKDDFERYNQYLPLRQALAQILESVDDSMMASGSEIMTKGAKPIYANVKVAKDQNVPGADSADELLSPYYDLPDQPDGGNP